MTALHEAVVSAIVEAVAGDEPGVERGDPCDVAAAVAIRVVRAKIAAEIAALPREPAYPNDDMMHRADVLHIVREPCASTMTHDRVLFWVPVSVALLPELLTEWSEPLQAKVIDGQLTFRRPEEAC